jgi:SAM-dependent methyltransferase
MDVAKLAFSSAIFDAVISQDTIEHVADDESFVAEAARVLIPGGTFIVFTPCRDVPTATPENPYHLREYSPESLSSLLHPHFTMVRLFGRRSSPVLRQLEATLDEVRRYDPLRLRALMPRSIRHRLGSLWLLGRGAKSLDQVSLEDVEYLEGPPPGSSTLIAICQRGS